MASGEGPLQQPRTEDDLKDISRLPDSVKEFQAFDGSPTQYISWIHSVEIVLKDFDIVKHKPIYRAIVQSIRQKVVGVVDTALISTMCSMTTGMKLKRFCLSITPIRETSKP